ncbi:MAG: ABC transporter permease [Candidatus Hydrogenedentes bacterium]|nr:ABC transporter permease [Candidatus Hydrogenedentota bacterium]
MLGQRAHAFRGILLIVRRSLRQHALSTAVTVCATALATGLVMSVFCIQRQTFEAFTGGALGFDAVLGARGSQLQLVLNAVFHLETSPGNISWSLYETFKNDRRVALAVPLATGDNYQGYRIVGTTDAFFTDFEYRKGMRSETEPGGRFFDSKRREAVIGSFAARRTGLKVGDTFHPSHGLTASEVEHDHPEEYVVVGVLKPTNTPNDRVIWIPIEGIFRMTGHVLRGTGEVYEAHSGQAIPDEHKEVSAVLLKFKNPKTGFDLDVAVNRNGNAATLAYPIGKVMADLFEKLGWMNRVLELVSYLVVAVAAAAILASIYNTINERRREFAILRALGARQVTVFTAIVLESGTIAAIGASLGFAVYGAILGVAASVIREQTGVVINVLEVHPALFLAPLCIIAVGLVAGVLPALKAYSTNVATNLTPAS